MKGSDKSARQNQLGSTPVRLDACGNSHHGLRRDRYAEVLVKNADGIDLRQGCHDIVIEHITGFTEDDSIALTGLHGAPEQAFAVDGLPRDICRVRIRDVRTAAFCTNVRLLNQGDIKLYDIEIDGVYDMSADCPHMDRGLYAVRIGDVRLYGSRHATPDETYNIAVRNVRGGGDYAIALAGSIRDLTTENVECFGGAQLLLDQREKPEN